MVCGDRSRCILVCFLFCVVGWGWWEGGVGRGRTLCEWGWWGKVGRVNGWGRREEWMMKKREAQKRNKIKPELSAGRTNRIRNRNVRCPHHLLHLCTQETKTTHTQNTQPPRTPLPRYPFRARSNHHDTKSAINRNNNKRNRRNSRNRCGEFRTFKRTTRHGDRVGLYTTCTHTQRG